MLLRAKAKGWCLRLCLLCGPVLWAPSSYGQTLSIHFKELPLEKAFRQVEQAIDQRFIYTRDMIEASRPATVSVDKGNLKQVLDQLFERQPLTYNVNERFIMVRYKPEPVAPQKTPQDTLSGRVTDENGNGLEGVNVVAMSSKKATATDANGYYQLVIPDKEEKLVISRVGYVSREVTVGERKRVDVQLALSVSALDETVIMAYGSTTKRLNTGNIGKVTGQEIARQPVGTVLAALEGRVPGLEVVQSSGIPGASFKLQIRGQNSILQGSDPLIVIDGVPFAGGNDPINVVTNSAGSAGLSPFNTIDPASIESVEVLKDADATAIYGSRGANGVILITTKRPKGGKTHVNARVNYGFSKVTRTMDMMNTQEYLAMRREAFANDGKVPTAATAPDLFLWDSTRYTDFKNLFIGGTARSLDAHASVGGGNEFTSFLLGSSFRKETTVFPGDLSDNRGAVHLSVNHRSADRKFTMALQTGYSVDVNRLISQDLTNYIMLPPHVELYEGDGSVKWIQYGTPFRILFGTNPVSMLFRSYRGEFQNFRSNVEMGYTLLPGLKLKSSFGYNSLVSDEVLINPRTSIDPSTSSKPFSNFGTSNNGTWLAEPQVSYQRSFSFGRFDVLAGGSFQSQESKSVKINGMNYSSDDLLYDMASAGDVTTRNSGTQYRYTATYARINYNHADEFILNLTGRLDGSSRFGPASRFHQFWSAGGAWIFSKSNFIGDSDGPLSFGKLRASYGVTGNDQIGDYQYVETWNGTSPGTYQGVATLRPTRLYNPDYSWEETRKLEFGLELGFFNDRLLVSASFFRNRSDNQLVNYPLPIQTGFSNVTKNLNALVENSGLEFLLESEQISSAVFSWKTKLNLYVPRNKLLDFPGLENSSYANSYVIGEPLSVRKVYNYLGVDPLTGIYQFEDKDGDGALNLNDRYILKNTSVDFSCGLENTLTYKRFDFSFLLELRNQTGLNFRHNQGIRVPGYSYINQPAQVLDRWTRPGDESNTQKYTSQYGSPAHSAASTYFLDSNGAYSDASFLRCRNISLAFTLANKLRISVQGQNVFTVSAFDGADPENQNLYVLPPLRTIVAGLIMNF